MDIKFFGTEGIKFDVADGKLKVKTVLKYDIDIKDLIIVQTCYNGTKGMSASESDTSEFNALKEEARNVIKNSVKKFFGLSDLTSSPVFYKDDTKKPEYLVSPANDFGTDKDSFNTWNPEWAINHWCKLAYRFPTYAFISCNPEDGRKLLEWAKSNNDKIRDFFRKYKTEKKYDVESFIDLVNKVDLNELPSEGVNQIHPFCIGRLGF